MITKTINYTFHVLFVQKRNQKKFPYGILPQELIIINQYYVYIFNKVLIRLDFIFFFYFLLAIREAKLHLHP